jgi:hypothetical protein
MVHKVLGESRDKCGFDTPGTSATAIDFDTRSTQGALPNPGMTVS